MDLTIIRIHVKKILTGNFVFMSLVAIIFGILTLFSKGQVNITVRQSRQSGVARATCPD